jgi:hypothetical protein
MSISRARDHTTAEFFFVEVRDRHCVLPSVDHFIDDQGKETSKRFWRQGRIRSHIPTRGGEEIDIAFSLSIEAKSAKMWLEWLAQPFRHLTILGRGAGPKTPFASRSGSFASNQFLSHPFP